MATDYKPVKKAAGEEGGAILRAHAEVIPFDGVTTAISNEEDVERQTEESLVRVRVVAPCDLPPGYKLLVKTPDGDSFDVIIPNKGVHSGQEFETNKFQPRPIEGMFSDGICGCCGEGSWFWIGWCCQGLAYGAIMEKLGLTWCADRTRLTTRPTSTYAVIATIWFFFLASTIMIHMYNVSFSSCYGSGCPGGVQGTTYSANSNYYNSNQQPNAGVAAFFGILGLFQMAVAIFLIVIYTKTRMAFRNKYRIPGDCCVDCLASYFCACCSALQMYRHMKRSGDRPARFEHNVGEAEIV